MTKLTDKGIGQFKSRMFYDSQNNWVDFSQIYWMVYNSTFNIYHKLLNFKHLHDL